MNEKRNEYSKYLAGTTAIQDSYNNLVSMIMSLEARAYRCGNVALNGAVHKLKRAVVGGGVTKKKMRRLMAEYDELCRRIGLAEKERQR